MRVTKVRANQSAVCKALGIAAGLDLSGEKNLMFNGSKISYRGAGWWRIAAYTEEKLEEAVKFINYMGGN